MGSFQIISALAHCPYNSQQLLFISRGVCLLYSCRPTSPVDTWKFSCVCATKRHRFSTRSQQVASTIPHRLGRWWNRSRESRHNAEMLQRRESPINVLQSLVNEQETIPNHRPNTLVPSGTQSALSPSHILVLFCHFNYPPFIWYRGPRPKAHWYMYTDVSNYEFPQAKQERLRDKRRISQILARSLNPL